MSLEFLRPAFEPGLVLKTTPEEKAEERCHTALQIVIFVFAALSHRLNHLFLGLAFVACSLNWVLVTRVFLVSSERRGGVDLAGQRVVEVEFLVLAEQILESWPDDGGKSTNKCEYNVQRLD